MSADSAAARGSAAPGSAGAAWVSQQGLRAVLAALDHLLNQNAGARERLRLHAGRQVRLQIDPSSWPGADAPGFDLSISQSGRLEAADPVGTPAVRIIVRPSVDAGFDFLREGAGGLQRHVRIEGDVLLAGAIAELSQRLRWDPEEDLSRYTGDVLARRLSGLFAATLDAARDLRQRAGRAFVRHWTVDDAQLVLRTALQCHADELSSLESRLLDLERRLRARG